MFTNKAAWQPSQKASSLKVETAPYTPPSRDMIVVKNAAVAINPIDSLIQFRGDIMFTYLKYPFILGCDTAGEVVEWRWARTSAGLFGTAQLGLQLPTAPRRPAIGKTLIAAMLFSLQLPLGMRFLAPHRPRTLNS